MKKLLQGLLLLPLFVLGACGGGGAGSASGPGNDNIPPTIHDPTRSIEGDWIVNLRQTGYECVIIYNIKATTYKEHLTCGNTANNAFIVESYGGSYTRSGNTLYLRQTNSTNPNAGTETFTYDVAFSGSNLVLTSNSLNITIIANTTFPSGFPTYSTYLQGYFDRLSNGGIDFTSFNVITL